MIYILIYVDDLLISGNNEAQVKKTLAHLGKEFSIRHLGTPKTFLGIQTLPQTDGYMLHQRPYTESIIHMAGLDNCNPVPTPTLSKEPTTLTNSPPFSNPKLYRQIAGSLQYLVITRPDIAFAVNHACQYMHQPMDHHFQLLTRIIRYLKGTPHLGLPITSGINNIIAYTDSDWAGSPDDRKSTTGLCIYLGPNLLTWKSQKQKTVARSSSEAEYRALSTTITEILWINRLLQEFKLNSIGPALVLCDNQSAISMARNPILKGRTKHIEIDHHFIREHINNGLLNIQYINTQDQIADIFTKRLPQRQFNYIRNKLTIQQPDHEFEGAC